jgi:hypothetical protein
MQELRAQYSAAFISTESSVSRLNRGHFGAHFSICLQEGVRKAALNAFSSDECANYFAACGCDPA